MPRITRQTARVIRPTSHGTRCTSHIARRKSHVIRHTLLVTRHTAHVTRQTSHVTRHTSHVILCVAWHTSHDARDVTSNSSNHTHSKSRSAAVCVYTPKHIYVTVRTCNATDFERRLLNLLLHQAQPLRSKQVCLKCEYIRAWVLRKSDQRVDSK